MSPPGCPKMWVKPCNRNAEESFPVLSLKSREQKAPNHLLIQDKDVLQPRRGPESAPLPVVAPEALPPLVQDKLRALLADRRFLPRGGTLAFPCSHLYHQDARFQRQQRPLSRQTVSALKGRDYLVAAAVLAEGLVVTFCPYLIENCADETWQLEHFPTPREQAALGEQMDPTDLEEALDIRAGSEVEGDFGLT